MLSKYIKERADGAINGSIVRGKVEIDKRVLIYYIVYFRI